MTRWRSNWLQFVGLRLQAASQVEEGEWTEEEEEVETYEETRWTKRSRSRSWSFCRRSSSKFRRRFLIIMTTVLFVVWSSLVSGSVA